MPHPHRMRDLGERTERDLLALHRAIGPVAKSRPEAVVSAGVLALARPLLNNVDRVFSRRPGPPLLPRLPQNATHADLAAAIGLAHARLVAERRRLEAIDEEFDEAFGREGGA